MILQYSFTWLQLEKPFINLYLPICHFWLNTPAKDNSETCVALLTFWHRSFTFNSNKSPTWCNKFSIYYPDVRLQLNVLRAFSHPSSGAQWLQWQPLVLPSYRGDSHAVFVVGPETCWAVNKRQDNKLENCCIRLVIYVNCTRTMMHGLTNLKFL